MSDKNSLLVGIDLGDKVTQISCFDRKTYEAMPVGLSVEGQEERLYEIPTAIKVMPEMGIWRLLCQQGDGGREIIIDKLLRKIEHETFTVSGQKFSAVDVMEHYMLKLLNILGEYFPDEKIERLVITVPQKLQNVTKCLQLVGKELGLFPDRMTIQNYRLSYMYYAVSQPKELWLNNVGLFSFDEESLMYSQINIDRRTLPWIVGVTERDLTDVFDYSMLQDENVDSSYAFINTAGMVLHKQMVTTLYMTGKGFDGAWANDALQELCNGRRVFRGQNIYTKGACFAARELAGEGKLEQCMFLDEEMISANISLRVYHEAKMQELVLAKAGSLWADVDVSVDVIPDNENEIQITTQDVIRHQTKAHMLSLNGFPGRENKTTRFTVRLRFADRETCVITLKDNGFGEISPTSNRIWERSIRI
ncbi:MAG: hypothetical protein J1E62_04600 [Lachnospiraceae bacterium]|nr:hypothetical protein [Lachnospiraceae bacterium]